MSKGRWVCPIPAQFGNETCLTVKSKSALFIAERLSVRHIIVRARRALMGP